MTLLPFILLFCCSVLSAKDKKSSNTGLSASVQSQSLNPSHIELIPDLNHSPPIEEDQPPETYSSTGKKTYYQKVVEKKTKDGTLDEWKARVKKSTENRWQRLTPEQVIEKKKRYYMNRRKKVMMVSE